MLSSCFYFIIYIIIILNSLIGIAIRSLVIVFGFIFLGRSVHIEPICRSSLCLDYITLMV